MRRSVLLGLVLLLAAALFSSPAEPAFAQTSVAVSNLGQANGSASSLMNLDLAQAFTTGSNSAGYNLDSVGVQLGGVADSGFFTKVAVTINTDSSGSPGTSLGTLTTTHSGTFTTDTVVTFNAPAGGIDLEAGATYWVVLDVQQALSGVNVLRRAGSNAEDAGGLSGWSIGDGRRTRARASTGGWNSLTGAYKIRVNATEKPVAVSNLGQANGFALKSLVNFDWAQAFTTGGNSAGYNLSSVGVQLGEVADSGFFTKVAVTINTDSSGSPGTSLGTLTTTHSGTFTSDTVVVFNAPAGGIDLEAGATYWLVLDVQQAPTGNNGARGTGSNAEDTGGLSGWSIADSNHARSRDDSDAWGPVGGSLKISVGATAKEDTLKRSFANDQAQAFTTGANPTGYTLSSIDVEFASLSDSAFASKVSAEVHTNPDHVKRHAVGILTIPSVTGTDLEVTLTAPEGGIHLRPNTTYWLLLDVRVLIPNGANSIRYTDAGSEDATYPRDGTTGFTIADSSRRKQYHWPTWTTFADSMNIRINGTARAPEVEEEPHLVSNFGQGNAHTSSISLNDIAQAFTTGSNGPGYNLESVDVQLARLDDRRLFSSRATVTIASDSGGSPGTSLGTLTTTHSGTFTSDTVVTFNASAGGIDLDPDTTYWFVVDVSSFPNGFNDIRTTSTDSEDFGAASGWSIGDRSHFRLFQTSSWGSTLVSLKLRINGTWNDGPTLFTPGHEAIYMREGETRTLGLTLAQELTSGSGQVTVTSSDMSVIKVNVPRWLVMGFDRVNCPPGGVSSGCWKGHVVQSSLLRIERSPLREVHRQPSASMTFGFDERDWAGYASREPQRDTHKGWREVKVSAERLSTHGQPGVDFGPDRVYDLTFSHADSGVSLPDPVTVVVSRGSGVMDPTFDPDVSDLNCRYFDCLTIAEGSSTTYTITNRIAPRPGQPLRITPTLVEGSRVTFSPAYVEWATIEDYRNNPSKTITVNAVDDDVYTKGRGIIRHVFNDNWDTNGWLSKRLQVPRTYTIDGNTHTFVVSREAAMSQFNMVVKVTQDEPVSMGSPEEQSDGQPGIQGTGTQGSLLGYLVDPDVVVKVLDLVSQSQHGPDHVNRWSRVLVAFGVLDAEGVTGGAMTADEAQDMADAHSSPVWDEVVTELTALEAWQASQSQDEQVTPTPDLSISAGSGITEGGSATFTITANPAPTSPITVKVGVSESGNFGASGAVTVQVSGATTTYTVTTTDDEADEADGSVTATLQDGTGYTVSSSAGSATVNVADNDDPAPTEYVVDPAVVNKVKALAAQTQHGTDHVNRWNRVLVAFGEHDGTGVTDGAMTADEAQDMADKHSSPVWDEVVTELTALEAWKASQSQDRDEQVTPTPELSISAGSGITEGGSATFTITANPAPASPITVNVGVSESGSFGATGAATVTVSGASTTYTVTTTDDNVDEADGSVTATLQDGSGYTVSSTNGAATVGVADNDDAPVITPELSIAAGSGITEGGSATFTITASPAPSGPITVKVGVSESGSFGASGAATVTVSGASTTYTISTTDDSADEADGSVTATLQDGSGYTVSSSNGAATVSVADNDDAPVITPVLSIAAGSGITEGGSATFTITASPAPSSPITVNVGVSESGSFGASGAAAVTVSGASTTYTISTTDDSADEADGSVTATLQSGSGYTVSSTNGAATVSVADNDVPELSISAGGGITEGGTATFTITASPAPASPITVNVGVSESGSFGATGAATITVSGASTTYTISTTDDNADEPDGSVTATLQDGTGYTVSSSAGSATVSVADNDDAAPKVEITLTVEEASANENDEYLEFTVRLSQASTEEIVVRWNTATAWDVVDNRAHGGDDYEEVFGDELVFAPGVTEMTGRVRLIQDGEAEKDEYFAVELFLPGSWWPADATVIMTIRDGD